MANRVPEFAAASKLATATQLLLVLSVLGHVGQAGSIFLAGRDPQAVTFLSPTGGSSTGWIAVVDTPTIIVFCLWWHRVTVNLRSLGATRLRYTPLQAVLAFFVPVVNLLWPAFVGLDIWRESDPANINGATAASAMHTCATTVA